MILYVFVLATTTFAAFLVEGGAVCFRGRTSCFPARQAVIRRSALAGIFLMLFLLSALRFETGNDYVRYEEIFRRIWGGWVVPTEPGFNVFIKGLQYVFGETNYIVFFAIFAFFTVLFMLRALYVLSENFAFSFFLFMCFGYYFNSMNTMRYYLAVAVAMWAISFIHRKKYGKFVLAILVAALFHKSVLLVIPIYLLANVTWKLWSVILISAFGVSGLFLGKYYLKLILILYPSYNNTEYLEGGTSYANILRCALVVGMCLLFWKNSWRENKQYRMYFRLNVGALLLYLCGSFIPEVSRIGTYMTITQVFLIPGVVKSISASDESVQNIASTNEGGKNIDARKKVFLTTFVAVMAAVFYFIFWLYKAYGDVIKLLPYHSWIFM